MKVTGFEVVFCHGTGDDKLRDAVEQAFYEKIWPDFKDRVVTTSAEAHNILCDQYNFDGDIVGPVAKSLGWHTPPSDVTIVFSAEADDMIAEFKALYLAGEFEDIDEVADYLAQAAKKANIDEAAVGDALVEAHDTIYCNDKEVADRFGLYDESIMLDDIAEVASDSQPPVDNEVVNEWLHNNAESFDGGFYDYPGRLIFMPNHKLYSEFVPERLIELLPQMNDPNGKKIDPEFCQFIELEGETVAVIPGYMAQDDEELCAIKYDPCCSDAKEAATWYVYYVNPRAWSKQDKAHIRVSAWRLGYKLGSEGTLQTVEVDMDGFAVPTDPE